MIKTIRNHVLPAALLGLFFGLCMPAAALDLASRPLAVGAGSVPPNILVAVDDSGSMDWELLLATTESGLLYMDGASYGYLFPNGYNTGDRKDGRVYSYIYAVPPIPEMAFTRAPKYNMSYFDPSVTYRPWPGKPNSDPQNAQADPVFGDSTFNLTQPVKKDGNGWTFRVTPGMTIPAGTGTSYKGYCRNSNWSGDARDEEEDEDDEDDEDDNQSPSGGCVDNWSPPATDVVVSETQLVGIKYYPATFYWPKNKPLPDTYSSYSAVDPVLGKGPNGNKTLRRIQIKPANFGSSAQYKAAIRNFANWFTYYRKRHLATRGGIVRAFKQINNVRVGTCTINEAERVEPRINMLELNSPGDPDRGTFRHEIYTIDFSEARDTPNRKGLQWLGMQLENNPDIITSPCQRNFAILFTDGFNNDPGIDPVGNVDNGLPKPFGDSYRNTIADIAMEYYQHLDPAGSRLEEGDGDLTPPAACPDNTSAYRGPLDCKTELHMVTFAVSLGMNGYIYNAPAADTYEYDGFTGNELQAVNAAPYANWPAGLEWPDPNKDLSDEGREQIDDLWHATINTRGAMLNARTPAAVADAFANVLTQIVEYTSGYAFSVALNSATLNAETLAYQASYVSGRWSGDLVAWPLEPEGADPVWKASRELNDMSWKNRVILTLCGGAAVAFRPGNLSACAGNLGAAEIKYIRGDRSNEQANGGSLRNRGNSILGDIVHSRPLYVGAPDRRYPGDWNDLLQEGNQTTAEDQAVAYFDPDNPDSFARRYADRREVVYVGANDGMLHGFDADTGKELIAYVPNAVLGDLEALTRPDYRHRFYVDGTPTAGGAFFGGQWHSVLVGGLRAGGKSIFALDITDSGTFSESNAESIVLWEFTHSELGYTYGKPQIVRLHNGKWAAIFGNGYNSSSGHAQLFIVDIATGELIERIDTGAGPDNGLGPVAAVDLDGDFITDYVYAGDLKGNLWKFDLTSDNPAEWTVSKLFHATDDNGTPQSITTQPQVGVHPLGLNYGVMVYFGTGKYLEPSDRAYDSARDAQNSFYGIWDYDVFTFNNADNGSPLFTATAATTVPESALVEQTMKTVTEGAATYRLVSDEPVNYISVDENGKKIIDKRGWVLDLSAGSGEMVIANATLRRSKLLFTTQLRPKDDHAESDVACTVDRLGGYRMVLDAATGGRTRTVSIDTNGDGRLTAADKQYKFNNTDAHRIAPSGVRNSAHALGSSAEVIDLASGTVYRVVPTQNGPKLLAGNSVHTSVRVTWREIRR